MAMEFASILSAEYADSLLKAGKAPDINQKPVGTGPFIFRSYTKDATIRFDGNPDYWKPNDVKISKLIFSITPDAGVRVQKLKRDECQVMSYPRPADIAPLKAEANIAMPSQPGFNLGYLSYNVHAQAARQGRSAPGARHGDQQEGDHRFRLPGRGPVGHESDAADPMVVRQEPAEPLLRSGRRPRRCSPRRVSERLRHHAVGDAGAARVQPERPSDGGNDPGRLGQDRREGEDRHV